MAKNEMVKNDSESRRITWKILTFIFAALFIISLVWNPFCGDTGPPNEIIIEGTLKEQMCTSIIKTPAWADLEGAILSYGYNETFLVDVLIEDNIYFLYHPGCGWCQKQIESFGEDWQTYVDSGYAVDCKEVREKIPN